jgi:hypothetical protein
LYEQQFAKFLLLRCCGNSQITALYTFKTFCGEKKRSVMEWLSYITVDTTIAFCVVAVAAVLTYFWHTPVARKKVTARVVRKAEVVKAVASGRKKRASQFSLALLLPTALRNIFNWHSAHALQVGNARQAPVSARGASNVPVQYTAVERLSRTDQWARVTGIVSRAIDGAGSVERWQQAAGEQLDAATYAISGLLDELAPVMPQILGEMTMLEVSSVSQSTSRRVQPRPQARRVNHMPVVTPAAAAVAA